MILKNREAGWKMTKTVEARNNSFLTGLRL